MGLARVRRRHHPLPQRNRSIRNGTAPRHRHRGARGHAGRSGGRRRRPLRGHGRVLRADDLDPHRRRVRHVVPPPLLARRARRRARVGGRPHRRGRHHRGPLGDRAPPPLRSPRRRNPPRLPRPPGLPATTPATRPRTRPATPSTRPSAPTGTARTGTRHRPAHRPSPTRGATPPPPGAPAPAAARHPPSPAARRAARRAPRRSAPRAARRSARRPSPAPSGRSARPPRSGRALPYTRGPAFGRTPVGRPHAARRAGDRGLALPGARGRRTASGKADDPSECRRRLRPGLGCRMRRSASRRWAPRHDRWRPPPARRACRVGRFSWRNGRENARPRPRPRG